MALLTNALGFAVIMLIDIPIVHELGITACLGVLLMIVTNKMILPIILTHMRLEESSRRHTGSAGPEPAPTRIWKPSRLRRAAARASGCSPSCWCCWWSPPGCRATW